MTILVVDSQEEAQLFRGTQIASGKGALIVNKDLWGDPAHLFEKILVEVEFDRVIPPHEQPWKKDSIILVVKGSEDKLKELEEALPRFTDFFGPVKEMPTL